MRMGPTRLNILASGSRVRHAVAVALLTISALASANAAEPREETGFGSNPGNLRMFSYVPANQEPAAPLILVLHGCKQKATTFARDAGCSRSLIAPGWHCCSQSRRDCRVFSTTSIYFHGSWRCGMP